MRGKDGDETGGVRRRDRRRVVVSNQERGRKRRKAQLKKKNQTSARPTVQDMKIHLQVLSHTH